MCGIYLRALCESLLDHMIKLRTNFNGAKFKFARSMVAKQMTSNTVVAAPSVTSCKYVLLASQVKSPWLNL